MAYLGDTFLKKQSYFCNLQEKPERLVYLPSPPEEISESINADWPQQQMVGRSAPITTYAGTSFKTFNFTLNLHKDLCDDLDWCNSYIEIINALNDCVYPKYGSNPGDYKQPRTRFVFGGMKIEGAVTSLGFTWNGPLINSVNPLIPTTACFPIYSNVKISVGFTMIEKNIPQYSDYNRGSYFYSNGIN